LFNSKLNGRKLGFNTPLRPVLVLRLILRPFFEVLVLTLNGLKDLKNCGLKTKKDLRPFLDLKDLKILILDEAKFQCLKF